MECMHAYRTSMIGTKQPRVTFLEGITTTITLSKSYSIINNRSLSILPIHKSQLCTCLSMNIIISFVRIMKFRALIICISIFLFLIVDTHNTSLESNQPNQLFGTYTISVGNPISHKVPSSTSSSAVYVKKEYCSKVLCIIQSQSRNQWCQELCPTIYQK